jgi:hypothetical protein
MEVISLAEPGDPIDISRLDADERQLWDEMTSSSSSEAPGMRVWSFGYICMLELGRVPAVVREYLAEHDPDNLVRQYWENVRKARWEGRI